MSCVEILSILVGVLAFWNIVLSVVLFYNYDDHTRIGNRVTALVQDFAAFKGKANSITKDVFNHLGVKLVTWEEKVVINTGEWYGPVCKKVERHALVNVGITPEEIELIKNPPEED